MHFKKQFCKNDNTICEECSDFWSKCIKNNNIVALIKIEITKKIREVICGDRLSSHKDSHSSVLFVPVPSFVKQHFVITPHNVITFCNKLSQQHFYYIITYRENYYKMSSYYFIGWNTYYIKKQTSLDNRAV